MPVVKVKGGYKIKGHVKGKPRLIGHDGQPFKSKKLAQHVSRLRSMFKHLRKRR